MTYVEKNRMTKHPLSHACKQLHTQMRDRLHTQMRTGLFIVTNC